MTTDERFIAACRKAAELKPGLFQFSDGFDKAVYLPSWNRGRCMMRYIGQDEIDQMAGVLGREYEVSRYVNFEPAPKLELGGLTYGIRKIGELQQHLGLDEYPDKLTAAKEAFCAIVEQIEKEK